MGLQQVDWESQRFAPFVTHHTAKSDSYSFGRTLDLADQVLSTVFGEEWLGGRLTSRRNRPIIHPMRTLWREMQPHLKMGRIRQEDLNDTSKIVREMGYAANLSFAMFAEGFNEQILPRLKKPDSFESAMFEASVAAKFAANDCQVEFVPSNVVAGRRTPDLKISKRGFEKKVEYKKKIIFSNNSVDKLQIGSLVRKLTSKNPPPPQMHISFVALEEIDPPHIEDLYNNAIDLTVAGSKGLFFDPDRSMGVLVAGKNEFGEDDHSADFTIHCKLHQNDQESLVSFGFLQSNRLASVLGSLRDGKKQFEIEDINVIAVQVVLDERTKKISLNHIILYFEVLRANIATFWNNNLNSRVKGVLLYQGPYMRHFRRGDLLVENPFSSYSLLLNPNFSYETCATSPVESKVFSPLQAPTKPPVIARKRWKTSGLQKSAGVLSGLVTVTNFGLRRRSIGQAYMRQKTIELRL